MGLGFLCHNLLGVLASCTSVRIASFWDHNTYVTKWGISWHKCAIVVVKLRLNFKLGEYIMKGFGTNVTKMCHVSKDEVGLVVSNYFCIDKAMTIAPMLHIAQYIHDMCFESENKHIL